MLKHALIAAMLLTATAAIAKAPSKPYAFEGDWVDNGKGVCISEGDEANVMTFEDDTVLTGEGVYKLGNLAFRNGEYTADYLMVGEEGDTEDAGTNVSIKVAKDRKTLTMTFVVKDTGKREVYPMTNCSVFRRVG